MGIHEGVAVQATLDRWRRALASDLVEQGLMTEEELELDVCEAAADTAIAITTLLLSIPHEGYSEDAILAEADDLLHRARDSYDTERMRDLIQAFNRNRANWPGIRLRRDEVLARADEWALVADARKRHGGTASDDTRAMGVEHYVDLGRRTRSWPAHLRLACQGGDAFGTQFLIDAVLAIYASGWEDEVLMQLADAALDELGSLAATTDPDALSAYPGCVPIATQARQALLKLAGYPELTAEALARLPQHRLDREDVETLQRLVADRAEVFDDRFTDNLEQARSVAGELALMRALDAAGVVRHHGR